MRGEAGPASDRLVVDVAGVHVAVRVPEPDPLRSVLARICVSGPARVDAVADLDGPVAADAETVLAMVARAAIEHSADLLFHAGSVVRDGRAVLFPGMSGAGKSTMTAACLRTGFAYMTDEMVAMDLGSGLVRGWPRPLMLTPWSMTAVDVPGAGPPTPRAADVAGDPGDPAKELGDQAEYLVDPAKELVDPARLGAPTVPGPVPVAHVVFVRHGVAATKLTPMDGADLLAALLACSFNHYRFGARAWEATARLAQAAAGWRLDLADLGEAVALVAGLQAPAPGSDVLEG